MSEALIFIKQRSAVQKWTNTCGQVQSQTPSGTARFVLAAVSWQLRTGQGLASVGEGWAPVSDHPQPPPRVSFKEHTREGWGQGPGAAGAPAAAPSRRERARVPMPRDSGLASGSPRGAARGAAGPCWLHPLSWGVSQNPQLCQVPISSILMDPPLQKLWWGGSPASLPHHGPCLGPPPGPQRPVQEWQGCVCVKSNPRTQKLGESAHSPRRQEVS